MLRGGIAHDDSWTRSPRQPLVVCSTVDQVGSSLLFRAYGTGQYAWPIRAGLAACDSLIILDEAHTSQPFAETLGRIRQYRRRGEGAVAGPFTVVEMSATPRSHETFRETQEDRNNAVLRRRWEAPKRARLAVEDAKTENEHGDDFAALIEGLVREARAMRDERGAMVIGVIANRVRTARMAFEELDRDPESATILLTGRARPWDRDRIWREWGPYIRLGRMQHFDKPIIVVSTQCIEVGANIDFDALVTEVASIDALEQRFGRLNRDGRDQVSQAVIVAQKNQTGAKYDDRVYGKALSATWSWLRDYRTKEDRTITLPAEGKKKPKTKNVREDFVEMGVLALRQALEQTPERGALTYPRQSAPVLLPAHLDLLCQTSPEPAVIPIPAIFLHGPQTEPEDVRVVWRMDLEPDGTETQWINTVTLCPPSAGEAIAMPVWTVRQWLRQQNPLDVADVEGLRDEGEEGVRRGAGRAALLWRGPEDSMLLAGEDEVRPGMTLVVPASYGGCDRWGWNPGSRDEVEDVGDAVKLALGRPMLRLNEKLAFHWKYGDLASKLTHAEELSDAREMLRAAATSFEEPWVAEAVESLTTRLIKLVEAPDDEMWVAVTGRVFESETVWSSDKEVALSAHLSGCEAWAARFADGLVEKLVATIVRAAALHDIGKADPRFQAWLRGGNPIAPNELIAKSKKSGQNAAAIERARALSGYPKGGRHELMSVALASAGLAESAAVDRDLLLHLIGSHHGRCRPFAPVVDDDGAFEVSYQGWSARTDHGLEAVGSGVSERFWHLVRRYGWYGLAYLEALVRLADHRQSAQEQTGRSEEVEAANA